MENEPSMQLSFGNGGEFEATPENTSLYRFVGRLACHNHVFIVTNPEESAGTYIFSITPVYREMEAYMVANDYPIHDHLRQVAQCDLDAYERMLNQAAENLSDDMLGEWGDGSEG